MSGLLKGNFKTKKKVELDESKDKDENSLENQFESEALKRLGGSIAFVSKKKVMWSVEDNENKSEDGKSEKK